MHWSSHLHEHCTWCTGRVIHPIRASACWHPSLYFFAWARYTVLKCRDTDAHICMSMMWSLGSLHRTPNAWCSHLTRSKCKYPIPLAIPTVLSTDNIFLLIATVHDKQSLPPYLNVCAIPASVVKAVASKIYRVTKVTVYEQSNTSCFTDWSGLGCKTQPSPDIMMKPAVVRKPLTGHQRYTNGSAGSGMVYDQVVADIPLVGMHC